MNDTPTPAETTPANDDLSYADLCGTNLAYADLRNAKLRGADLRRAHLAGTDLRRVKLPGANLDSADLDGANLRGAILSHASMRGTTIDHVDLAGTILAELESFLAPTQEILYFNITQVLTQVQEMDFQPANRQVEIRWKRHATWPSTNRPLRRPISSHRTFRSP